MADDIVQTIRIDGDQQVKQSFRTIAEAGGAAFDRLNSAASQVSQAMQPISFSAAKAADAMGRAGQAAQQVGQAASGMAQNMGAAADRVGRASRELNEFSVAAGAANAASGLLSSGVGKLTAAVAAYLALGKIKDTIDTYTNLQSKLRLVTKDSAELEKVTLELAQAARDTQAGFEPTVNLFQKLTLATKDLRLTQKEVIDLTKSINQALKISGATGSEAASGLTQLAQALRSGKLAGDEFKSIMENFTYLADQIAEGMGTTTAKLKELSEEGKLTTDRIVAALQRQAPEIQKAFGKVTPTISGSIQQLSDAWTIFLGKLDKAKGLTETVGKAFDTLTSILDEAIDVLDGIENKDMKFPWVKTILDDLSAFGNGIKAIGAFISEMYNGIMSFFDMIAAGLNKAFSSNITGMDIFLGVLKAIAIAIFGLPAAIVLLITELTKLVGTIDRIRQRWFGARDAATEANAAQMKAATDATNATAQVNSATGELNKAIQGTGSAAQTAGQQFEDAYTKASYASIVAARRVAAENKATVTTVDQSAYQIKDAWRGSADSVYDPWKKAGQVIKDAAGVGTQSMVTGGAAMEQANQTAATNSGSSWDTWKINLSFKIDELIAKFKQMQDAASAAGSAASSASSGAAYARGGPVWGRGTATSDSIPAWLSTGEFVIKAAAVRKYGAALFHALNNMRLSAEGFQGFALGGLVLPSRPAFAYASGGPVTGGGGGRPLTLVIDGQRFGGMQANASTVRDLERCAVRRGASSGGRKPSWFGGK